MKPAPVPSHVLQHLEERLQAMTAHMVSGNRLDVARTHADNALLTDLREFRVEGRQAIDEHWAKLPAYKEWQLRVLESGGDADNPYQRLHSVARMEIRGKEYVDEGYCFVVWKKQANGHYQIHVDICHPLKFEPQEKNTP